VKENSVCEKQKIIRLVVKLETLKCNVLAEASLKGADKGLECRWALRKGQRASISIGGCEQGREGRMDWTRASN